MDVAALKDRIRASWTEGTYAGIEQLTWQAAGPIVDACAISAGQGVLDVAAGTGNVAVLAAREGARVVALDLTPALIAQGRERTDAEGLDVTWVEGDAEELPFEDGSFDCAVSVFGAMFAPRPERVASELFRVVGPGGTVGLASWTPEGYQGRSFAITARYLPPPEAVPAPTAWGDEETVRARLSGLASSVSFERRFVRLAFASHGAMRDFFAATGPGISVGRALSGEQRAALSREQAELADELNQATDGSLAIDAEYLQVVARRRG